MHDKGNGKLLITSNYETPDKLVHELTTGATITDAQATRLKDRVAGALLGHVVEGASYRLEKRASQSPWWLAPELPPKGNNEDVPR